MIPIVIQVSNINNSIKDRNFREIAGRPAIEYLLQRLINEAETEVVISTSTDKTDDIFETIAQKYNVKIVRAAYSAVLERLYKAIDLSGAENIVRVFANYPLLDIEEMKLMHQTHISENFDYSYNEHSKGVLWGTGCEIFSKDIIKQMISDGLNRFQQETLSFYVRQNENKFKVHKIICCEKRPGYKLCLESEKDYEVISEIVNHVPGYDSDKILSYLNSHKVLARYNYENPPQEVGVEKILLHPEKVKALTDGRNDVTYPISVELTLTNICNLKCCFCSDQDLRTRQGLDQSFDINVLKRLFDDLAAGGTTGVTLEGGGEPTLYPEFAEVVRYARNAGLAVGLITNGTVRLSEELLRAFEWIRVSLDASNEKEYLDLKGVDCFERVMNNIAHYAKYCGTVGVGYVVTSKNLAQIEPLVMRLREIKASYIQLRPVVDCEELYPENADLSYLKIFQTRDFGVITEGMVENAETGNHGLPCVANGLTSVISGDGEVYLCGRLNIYSWLKPIGNVNEKSFHGIWNGEERKKQREMVLDAEFCDRNCPQCRVSKFNQLFFRLHHIKSKNFI